MLLQNCGAFLRRFESDRCVEAPAGPPNPARCPRIPLQVLLDAFAADDEELEPLPDWGDFSCEGSWAE